VLLGFSAGAVLGVVFFDVLPEALAAPATVVPVTVATAAGFLAFFALERATALHSAREHPHARGSHDTELGVLAAAGLSVHSFLDGVAIGIGFQTSSEMGLVISLAVITHDFNDGLNTVTVMLAHGNPLRRSLSWLLVDMLTPLVGAASTLLFRLPETVLPWMLDGRYAGGLPRHTCPSSLSCRAPSAERIVGPAVRPDQLGRLRRSPFQMSKHHRWKRMVVRSGKSHSHSMSGAAIGRPQAAQTEPLPGPHQVTRHSTQGNRPPASRSRMVARTDSASGISSSASRNRSSTASARTMPWSRQASRSGAGMSKTGGPSYADRRAARTKSKRASLLPSRSSTFMTRSGLKIPSRALAASPGK
jgi:ZIP family zinc transporter